MTTRLSGFAALVLAAACVSSVAQAGDHYFACATPGGNYEFSDGELRQGDKVLAYKTVRKITIRQQEGICTAKNGSKYQWDSHTYLHEIVIKEDGKDVKLLFLCDEANSGVPANVPDCVSRTTLDRELKPAYREKTK